MHFKKRVAFGMWPTHCMWVARPTAANRPHPSLKPRFRGSVIAQLDDNYQLSKGSTCRRRKVHWGLVKPKKRSCTIRVPEIETLRKCENNLNNFPNIFARATYGQATLFSGLSMLMRPLKNNHSLANCRRNDGYALTQQININFWHTRQWHFPTFWGVRRSLAQKKK